MDIYQIDISGGYQGTVETSEGDIKIEFPSATLQNKIKRYNLHLSTPDKKNIEFNLLRFPDGEWCDQHNLQLEIPQINSELREAAKKEIIRMRI